MQLVPDPSPKRYTYDAIVREVYDGDSIRVDVDLGFGLWIRGTLRRKNRLEPRGEALRLAGIDAPELRGETRELGLASRMALATLLLGFDPRTNSPATVPLDNFPPTPVVVETIKDDDEKYGRMFAKVYARAADGSGWICVNDELVAAGFARAWDGRNKLP